MQTPFTLWMNFLHVQMICITDLYDCVNSYTVIILSCMLLYVLDTFHIVLSGDSLRDLRNVYICMYVCMYVCMQHISNVSLLQENVNIILRCGILVVLGQ